MWPSLNRIHLSSVSLSQSSVEQRVVVGNSWKLDASSLELKVKSNVSYAAGQLNRRTCGTDLLLPCRRLFAMSAVSLIWLSTSVKVFSITGDESPLLEDVSLAAGLMFPEMDRRLPVSPIFNFSINILIRGEPPRCKGKVFCKANREQKCSRARHHYVFIIRVYRTFRSRWLVFHVTSR